MADRRNAKILYSVLAAVGLVALLLTPTQAFAKQGVSFLDTELRAQNDASKVFVNTKYPIGDKDKLAQFPTKLGKWNMSTQYQWDSIAQLLDTDVLLARDYRAPGVYVPVSLVIIQSTNISSFHPAPVCYTAQGFTIDESSTGTVTVPVTDGSWAKRGVFEGSDNHAFQGNVVAKRLVVTKTLQSGATIRELNLYFYLKEEQGNVAQRIEWVRMSMYVPTTGDLTKHEELLGSFLGEVVPELFSPTGPQETTTLGGALLSKVTGGAL